MNDKNAKNEIIKILTLGESSVGKTSFILRYTENTFSEIYLTTMGIDFKTKVIKLKNKKTYSVLFYDTAGQEKYRSISLSVIKNVQGVILMYDITNKKSFESISRWMENIREIKGNYFPIILLGNKCELEEKRVVSKNDAEQLAQKYGIELFEVSNKAGINIDEAGLCMINKVVEEKEKANNLIKDFEVLNDKDIIKLDKNLYKEKEKHKQKCNCKNLKL